MVQRASPIWSSSLLCTFIGTSGESNIVELSRCLLITDCAGLSSELFCVCRERNIREIYSMYEVSFVKLSERFFKGTTWPAAESIADLVDHDHVFCLLYKVNLSSALCLPAEAPAKRSHAVQTQAVPELSMTSWLSLSFCLCHLPHPLQFQAPAERSRPGSAPPCDAPPRMVDTYAPFSSIHTWRCTVP